MEFTTPLAALALAFVAVASAAWGLQLTMVAAINAEALSAQLLKLIAAQNVARARKLCVAASDEIPSAVGFRAMAALGATPPPASAEGHGYREGDGLLGQAEEALRGEYERATGPLLRSLRAAVAARSAAALAALGAASALASPLSPFAQWGWYQAAWAGAWLLLLAGARGAFQVHGQTRAVLSRTAAPLARAWVGGALREEAERDAGPWPERAASFAAAGGLVFDVSRPGEAAGRVEVSDLTVIKLGRHAKSHVVLDHPSVARMHAVIERADGAVTLIDLGAQSGTLVNGQKIAKQDLRHGDVIQLGEVTLRIGIGGPPP